MLSSPPESVVSSSSRRVQLSAARRVSFASGSSVCPASVSVTSWLLRRKSGCRSSFSSCRIWCESVLCVMNSSLAAAEKFSVSASRMKYLSCRSSIVTNLLFGRKVTHFQRITQAIIEEIQAPAPFAIESIDSRMLRFSWRIVAESGISPYLCSVKKRTQ